MHNLLPTYPISRYGSIVMAYLERDRWTYKAEFEADRDHYFQHFIEKYSKIKIDRIRSQQSLFTRDKAVPSKCDFLSEGGLWKEVDNVNMLSNSCVRSRRNLLQTAVCDLENVAEKAAKGLESVAEKAAKGLDIISRPPPFFTLTVMLEAFFNGSLTLVAGATCAWAPFPHLVVIWNGNYNCDIHCFAGEFSDGAYYGCRN